MDQFEAKKASLNLLLEFAQNIPYYKNLKLISPNISDYYTWKSLPLTSKRDVQKNWTQFIDPSINIQSNRYTKTHTSGSTGMPLTLIKDRKSEIRLTKVLWKRRRTWDSDIMNRRLLYLYRNVESPHQKVLCLDENSEYLDLSDENLQKNLKSMLEFSPEWIIGSPSAVCRLAVFCQNNCIAFEGIKLVEVYGEMLLPYQRDMISAIFKCNIANLYGAREVGVISYECPYHMQHSFDDEFLFEVMGPDGEMSLEGTGELIITTLKDRTMPLIRYATGDIVQLASLKDRCPCGTHSSTTVTPIDGRQSDFVYVGEKVLSSSIFDTFFSRYIIAHPRAICAFQVIQQSKDVVQIIVCPDINFDEKVLRDQLNMHFDALQPLTYSLKLTHYIKNEPSMKTRTFIALNKKEKCNE